MSQEVNNLTEQKVRLIKKNLHEIIDTKGLLEKIVAKRSLRVYWGTAPTGTIHLGYLLGLKKIKELLEADCEVTILLADIHAVLDNLKSTNDIVKLRTEYYKKTITLLLKALNVSVEKLKFVVGSDFQYDRKYMNDLLKITSFTRVNAAKHANAEVVKQDDNPLISCLLYPYMQALDEIYLNSDAQLGGRDQRKIMTEARDILPKIGYKTPRIHLMNKMLPALSSERITDPNAKMSASSNNKIEVYDSAKMIRKKINSTYLLAGDLTGNSIFPLIENVIWELNSYKLEIKRKEEYGGNKLYTNLDELKKDFSSEQLHPQDLKNALAEYLVNLLKPLREELDKNKEFKKLINKAYSK